MTLNLFSRYARTLAVSMLAGVILPNATQAATTIDGTALHLFRLGEPQTLNVQASAWYKSAFGLSGWTHFSQWGYIKLKAGQKVTITADGSTVVGLHPGISVWQRTMGKKFAPIEYFIGHSYNEYNSIQVAHAKDESSGAAVGNFRMAIVANGYDKDQMIHRDDKNALTIPPNPSLNGIEDGVTGQVTLEFRAKKTGIYQFVVGGVNPDDQTSTAGGFDNNASRWPVTITVAKASKK